MIGDSICYLIACQYCRQCHVSSGQCLSDAHDVRFHSGVFPGKEFAGASESCGYFVKDQEDIVFFAEFFRFTQILRVIKPHTACSLNNGFEDERRQFFRVFLYRFPQGDDVVRIPFSVKSRRGGRNEISDRKR